MTPYALGVDLGTTYTAAAVALYALLNGALTYWIGFVEKGVVYQGTAPDGSTVCSSSQKVLLIQGGCNCTDRMNP